MGYKLINAPWKCIGWGEIHKKLDWTCPEAFYLIYTQIRLDRQSTVSLLRSNPWSSIVSKVFTFFISRFYNRRIAAMGLAKIRASLVVPSTIALFARLKETISAKGWTQGWVWFFKAIPSLYVCGALVREREPKRRDEKRHGEIWNLPLDLIVNSSWKRGKTAALWFDRKNSKKCCVGVFVC